jgi:hypothetical protein
MITPRATWAYDRKYKDDLVTWMRYCRDSKMRCFSMGPTVRDAAFDQQGIHVQDRRDLGRLWALFRAEWNRTLASGTPDAIISPPAYSETSDSE